MTDHLANLSVDELAKWYWRLADYIILKNKEACSKNQPCVADPLAADMLIKWLENRNKGTVHNFSVPSHLRSSKKYLDALKFHRKVFLTEKKRALVQSILVKKSGQVYCHA